MAYHKALFCHIPELFAKQELAHSHCHSEGHEERGEHRKNVCNSQRLEKSALQTAKEKKWHKYDQYDQCGKYDRLPYLIACLQDDCLMGQTLPLRKSAILLQSLKNVFHTNDSIVHERANGDSQAAQCHNINGKTEGPNGQQCGGNRNRNGHQCNDRGTKVE